MGSILESYLTVYGSTVAFSQLIFPVTVGVALFSSWILELIKNATFSANGLANKREHVISTITLLNRLKHIFNIGLLLSLLTIIMWCIMFISFLSDMLNDQMAIANNGTGIDGLQWGWDFAVGSAIFLGSIVFYSLLSLLALRFYRELIPSLVTSFTSVAGAELFDELMLLQDYDIKGGD